MVDLQDLVGVEHASFYLSVLTSLREFDRCEVEPVLSGQFDLTKREECLYALYLRAQRNIDTLIELKHVAHFQAMAMLSRTLFELRVDVELLIKTVDAELRMLAYQRLELLRAARSMITSEDSQCPTNIPSERRRFVEESGPTIDQIARSLWPGIKPRDLKHWTGLNLARRAKSLGPEVERVYIYSYQQFSWYSHGGVQGTLNAPADHFPRVCGMALSLSVVSYSRLLTLVARAMRVTFHDEAFEKKLELVLGLPQTETEGEELQLRRDLGL